MTSNSDPRVQAIRCTSCNRLRPYPLSEDTSSIQCFCGGRTYTASEPYPDEVEWAVSIYEKELKAAELWKYT